MMTLWHFMVAVLGWGSGGAGMTVLGGVLATAPALCLTPCRRAHDGRHLNMTTLGNPGG